jgi:homoserine dehydrogenase
MKSWHLFALICATVFSSFCCAEQEESTESLVKPIQELAVKELNFEDLPKESQVGNLAELVKEEESQLADILTERVKKKKKSSLIMYPNAEMLAYVNGQLCHVGYYPQSIIYTVLEGPYYGTQTTTAVNGVVLYVNYDYVVEYTVGGVVFHHYYSDSEVVTGSNQIVRFY